MIVERPQLSHLPMMANCHRKAFPKALSSAMGQYYVEKMLEWYLADPNAFAFCLEEKGTCIGYCGGIVVNGSVAVGSASGMIQYSFRAAVLALLVRPWLFFHTEFLKKYRLVLKNVWRRLRASFGMPIPRTAPRNQIPPHVGLVVIGVDPAFQKQGYGSVLLLEFERQSVARGFKHIILTVRSDNEKAIRSYERNGWQRTKAEDNSTTMEKRLV